MTPLALTFMVVSWSLVLGLATWCFHRVLRSQRGGPADGPESNARPEDR